MSSQMLDQVFHLALSWSLEAFFCHPLSKGLNCLQPPPATLAEVSGECTLLYRKIEEKKGSKDEEKERETFRKKKVERCWTNWLTVFLIYTGTIIKAYPDRGFALLQYLDLIHRAYVDLSLIHI